MATQQLAIPQAPDDLIARIASYHGHYYEFLLWLIANPSRPQTEGMRSLGLEETTLYSWRRDVAGFKETIQAIQEYRGDLRSIAALTKFQSATVGIADAMVSRALSDGKDAQRAGERILETVGVLRSEKQTDIALSITDRAMQMWVRRQEGAQVRQATVTVAREPEGTNG